MDIAVLTMLEVFTLILTLFGFMGKKVGWQLFPIFGGMVGLITALVLVTDASLVSGATVLAAANGNFISDFNAISWLATLLGVAPLVVAARRIFKI